MIDFYPSSGVPYGGYATGGYAGGGCAAGGLGAVSTPPIWSPIASGATDGETQSAIDDSSDASVIATLGDAPPQSSDTYNAAGLLNSFVQAGTPVADPDDTDSGLAPAVASEDGAVYDAEASNGSNPDASAAPGGFPNLWGNSLATNPWESSTVVDDATDQGLVSSLSSYA